MVDLATVVVVAGSFLFAGTVKGVIGLGLPTVSLGLLAVSFDLTTAMALLIVPSFVTNLWQAVVGGQHREIARRMWPFLLGAGATVWIGAIALRRLDLVLLSGLLGLILMVYSVISLAGYRLTIPSDRENWAGLFFGTANGVLTGMTGSFVPGIMFLQALRLPRDTLVQAMGMLFTVSTVALAMALHSNNLLTIKLGLISTGAVLPAILGMIVGQRLRQGIAEARFQQIFFVGIFLLGGYIMVKAMFATQWQ